MTDTATSTAHTDASKGKAVVKKSGPSTQCVVLGLFVGLLVAAAVAIPVGIVFWPDDDSPQLSVQVTFTANGDVSDYSAQATQDSILGTLSTAAGFAAVPAGSTLTLSSGSVVMLADFPVADAAAQETAKVALETAMPDQATAQTLMRTAVPTIVIESVVSVDSNDGSGPAPPPPPFALNGHWVSNWGNGITFTNDYKVTMSSYSRSFLPITSYASNYYIVRRPASDTYNPGAFQKVFFHTNTDGSIAECTAISDAATESEAIAFDGVGVYYSNTTQCGTFTHSVLTPFTMADAGLAGSWTSGGAALTITETTWTSVASSGTTARTIYAFSNQAVVAQLSPDDQWNPNAWSLIEFHDLTSNGFAYCVSHYNAATMNEAVIGLEGAYDSGNATNGCGASYPGFSHSIAARVTE